jgi:hypothetical protein
MICEYKCICACLYVCIYVCVCVHFQQLNQLKIFHVMWYEFYAVGGHPKRQFEFPTFGKNNMADARTCDVGAILAPFCLGSRNGLGS